MKLFKLLLTSACLGLFVTVTGCAKQSTSPDLSALDNSSTSSENKEIAKKDTSVDYKFEFLNTKVDSIVLIEKYSNELKDIDNLKQALTDVTKQYNEIAMSGLFNNNDLEVETQIDVLSAKNAYESAFKQLQKLDNEYTNQINAANKLAGEKLGDIDELMSDIKENTEYAKLLVNDMQKAVEHLDMEEK